MSAVRALVLTGFGLNCDRETAYALQIAGAHVERLHLNGLIKEGSRLRDFQIFVVGGGFSWGDDHGAGVVMAMRMKHRLQDEIQGFIDAGGLVLGICNGFQVLVNLGVLPGFKPGSFQREVALIGNDCGQFRDQWVRLLPNPDSPCVFTRGLDSMELPVRHGEGKFFADSDTLDRLIQANQVIFTYATPDGKRANGQFPFNPNGSLGDIAGICDPTGRVAGLMPHPEAYNHASNHPDWTYIREKLRRSGQSLPPEGQGIRLFRNAVSHFA